MGWIKILTKGVQDYVSQLQAPDPCLGTLAQRLKEESVLRTSRVNARQNQKVSAYGRRLSEIRPEEPFEDAYLQMQHSIGWQGFTEDQLLNFVTSGVEGYKVRQIAAKGLRRGRTYLHGTTADMMVHTEKHRS